jgi:hypothetical protein
MDLPRIFRTGRECEWRRADNLRCVKDTEKADRAACSRKRQGCSVGNVAPIRLARNQQWACRGSLRHEGHRTRYDLLEGDIWLNYFGPVRIGNSNNPQGMAAVGAKVCQTRVKTVDVGEQKTPSDGRRQISDQGQDAGRARARSRSA